MITKYLKMKEMKQGMITLLLSFVALTGWAKGTKTVVWEQPTIEYGTCHGDGFFFLALDVTRVELKDNETVVYITASQRSDYPEYWFRFAGDTYLNVGGMRYAVLSADGIELNKQVLTHKDGKRDMAFHFQPLPKDTKVFDFIEGDGEGVFQIKGIKPVEERWKQLFPSYWRDDKGDWKIAFFDDCAIYDCKFWDYKQCDVNRKTGEATIVMTNGNQELKVTVGKDKKGVRPIQIGSEKAAYSMITTRFLPDYPTKDMRTDFVDTGYKEDTITVVGWIKDMPEHFKQVKAFQFNYMDIFGDAEKIADADLDEQGRFSVKIPVVNSTEFFFDWRRCFVHNVLEAGKTYFLLYDYKEGRRYFMGDDSRLQNELFKYPIDWNSVSLEHDDSGKRLAGDSLSMTFAKYIPSVDSLIKTRYAWIDSLCLAHPTLSARFCKYRKGSTLWQQANRFGQARFIGERFMFPDNARQYATNTFWTQLEQPFTIYRNINSFLRDYLGDALDSRSATVSWNLLDHLDEIASNDEEQALLNRWKDWITDATAQVEAAPTDEERLKVAKKLNDDNADMIQEVDKILGSTKARKIMNTHGIIARLNDHAHVLDSLGADPLTKDLWLARMVLNEMEGSRTSQSPDVIDALKALCGNPVCIAMVEKRNEHYLAIENREFDKLVLKSSDNLADLSEGEALLKKILEPYKGKFVLLDVWGTWCGPCKEALSHSTEEYERLKDYDIEFLYLANNSPQTAWENVIKEYNVSGPNVAHYNLPANQQAAIERHLNVNSWPTYKLFNRDGDLLDLNVDARHLDNLVKLLEQMK